MSSQQPNSQKTVPTDYKSSLARVKQLAQLKPGAHIHVSGICGTGMAAVATLLKQLGYKVTGSDKAFYPPMGETVRRLGVPLFEGYTAENLKQRPDLVVIGNSLSRGNPEVEHVIEMGIPYASMPEVFQALLIGTHEHCPNSIVVAGTHGKTTTTAAIATMFDTAGLKPGYFVGGMPRDLPGGIRAVSTEMPVEVRIVVLEGDEYDSAFFAKWPKFHSYRPDILIVTSLEFDHADIYRSITEIAAEFSRVVTGVPQTGHVLICDREELLKRLAAEWLSSDTIRAKLAFYGMSEEATYRLVKRELVERDGVGMQHLVMSLDGVEVECVTPLTGHYNALNLLAAGASGRLLGLSAEQIRNGLESFHGVMRRQQVLADKNGILVIEDFAHHPTAVDATLLGLKERYSGRRLVAVFEPRSNTSRRDFFQAEYAQAFSAADAIVIQEVEDASGYTAMSTPQVALNVPKIVSELAVQGKEAKSFRTTGEIEGYLTSNIHSGDVVVIMSNGEFGGLMKSLVEKLG